MHTNNVRRRRFLSLLVRKTDADPGTEKNKTIPGSYRSGDGFPVCRKGCSSIFHAAGGCGPVGAGHSCKETPDLFPPSLRRAPNMRASIFSALSSRRKDLHFQSVRPGAFGSGAPESVLQISHIVEPAAARRSRRNMAATR